MTMNDSRILVIANCTHHSLALAIRASGMFSKVDSAELYSMSEEARSKLAEDIDEYGFVLSLEHGEGFNSLSTQALRARLGSRLVSLPTPFFSGLMPDMAYLQYEGEIARSAAVLGDYHSALILDEVRSGFTIDEVTKRYVSGEAFERLNVEAIWSENLTELRKREAKTNLSISSYIEHAAAKGTLAGQFLSFNHPTEGLINYIAQGFIRHITGQECPSAMVTKENHNLYADACWPLHPVVAERLGVQRTSQTLFKQPNRLGGKYMTMEEFAHRSATFFISGRRPERFTVVTPHYLLQHIRRFSGRSVLNSARSQTNAPVTAHTAPRKIVMTHFGRSGSTVLAEMLKQHSKIFWLNEFFSLKWIHEPETYDFTLQQMVDMIDAEVARIHEEAPDMMVGHEIKLMNFMQNPSCNMVDYAQASSSARDYTHIVLRRRNVLNRICSTYKAAQTKVYHVRDVNEGYKSKTFRIDFENLIDYDTGQKADTFPDLIDRAIEREEQVLENYRAAGINYLEINYEDDIEADPQVAYCKVIDFLGLPSEPGEVSLGKTSAGLRKELENYDDLEAQMRGSKHAWMLP